VRKPQGKNWNNKINKYLHIIIHPGIPNQNNQEFRGNVGELKSFRNVFRVTAESHFRGEAPIITELRSDLSCTCYYKGS
jgi:hypothetical protein